MKAWKPAPAAMVEGFVGLHCHPSPSLLDGPEFMLPMGSVFVAREWPDVGDGCQEEGI